MSGKKTPMRMCVGCRQMKPKSELVRIVRTTDGEIKLDATGKLNGRGAYICRDRECLKKSQKMNALSRALDSSVSAEVFNQLETELEGNGK